MKRNVDDGRAAAFCEKHSSVVQAVHFAKTARNEGSAAIVIFIGSREFIPITSRALLLPVRLTPISRFAGRISGGLRLASVSDRDQAVRIGAGLDANALLQHARGLGRSQALALDKMQSLTF